MIGVKNTIITDDEAVKMHTNFADFSKVRMFLASAGDATFYKSNGILFVKTATTFSGFTPFAFCPIPAEQLSVGKKYGISVTSNFYDNYGFQFSTPTYNHIAKNLSGPLWKDGVCTEIVRIEDEDISQLGIYLALNRKDANYVISDMKIWEIDE